MTECLPTDDEALRRRKGSGACCSRRRSKQWCFFFFCGREEGLAVCQSAVLRSATTNHPLRCFPSEQTLPGCSTPLPPLPHSTAPAPPTPPPPLCQSTSSALSLPPLLKFHLKKSCDYRRCRGDASVLSSSFSFPFFRPIALRSSKAVRENEECCDIPISTARHADRGIIKSSSSSETVSPPSF